MKISVKIVLLLCTLFFLILPSFAGVLLTLSPFAVSTVQEAGFQLAQEFVSFTAGSLSSVLESTSIAIQGAANSSINVGAPFSVVDGINRTALFLLQHALTLPQEHDGTRVGRLICRYYDQSAATFERFGALAKIEIYQASNANHLFFHSMTTQVHDTPEN